MTVNVHFQVLLVCIAHEHNQCVHMVSLLICTFTIHTDGLSLLNEDGGLRVFFPRNSFVTNTTLTHTNTPRKELQIDPAVGNDHIVCDGGNDLTLLVAWHSITRRLVACANPCMACGTHCQGNGGVGVDPQDGVHTDIHMYTDSTAYVNQDLECQVASSQSAFIGVYLINGGECCVSYVLIYCTCS